MFYFTMYVLVSLCIGTSYAYFQWSRIAEALDDLSRGCWNEYGGGPYYVGAALMLSLLWPFVFYGHLKRSVRLLRWRRVPPRLRRLAKLMCLAAIVRRVAEDTLRKFRECK